MTRYKVFQSSDPIFDEMRRKAAFPSGSWWLDDDTARVIFECDENDMPIREIGSDRDVIQPLYDIVVELNALAKKIQDQ